MNVYLEGIGQGYIHLGAPLG